MVVDKKTGAIEHTIFSCLGDYLKAGDLLVLNDARVIPARLTARKESGGRLEIFLLRKQETAVWEVLLRGKISAGKSFAVGPLQGRVMRRTASGSWLVRFNAGDDREILKHGEVPLPPYIRRAPQPSDREDYQTVYAARNGAVAAPTAGLHFTRKLLNSLQEKGVLVSFLTLFIGWASFRLLREDQQGSVPGEVFEIPEGTARRINECLNEGKRIMAVGTSTVRAIESSVKQGRVVSCREETFLFIQPGFSFKVVHSLITNFHLPGSTHLSLVCALAGTELMKRAYQQAIEKRYRFYSYGDAMLIL